MPFCSSDFTSFTLPTMLAATPPGAQATFVAINGMLSTTPPGPQLTTNPGSMLAMQSGIGSSTFIPNQNLTAGPYFFPSGFPSGSPNLTCTVPFSSPQFQPSILPFFTPGGNNMLATNPPNPITLSSPFSGPLSHLIHQPPGNPINPFPSSISGASLINPLGIPTSTLQDASQIPMNTLSSTLVSNQIPSNSVVLPTLSITVANGSSTDSLPLSLTLPSSNAVFSSDSLVGLTSPSITSVCTATSIYTATAFPSVPSSSAPTTVTSSISLPGTSSNPTTEVTSEHICVTPTLRSSFKIDKSQSIAPTTTSTDGACSTGLHALESVDFHRDAILDAIDKLRERKARPDFERISCLLKRYQNINPDQTQLCLGRLAAAGAVVCVDYKGNLSYRNPSKWRKTATSSSVTNPANITQRLVEAIRYLISGPMDRSSLCVQPGPNGGYSLFQIERALQTLRAKSETSQKAVPELIGATLRVCLDREATHGKLAKTIDGRYLLDESGERKKLANISTTLPTMLLNKKPLPPNSLSTAFLAPSGTSKYAKVPTTIAPAGEYITTNRPLAVKQVPVNAVSIAPVGARSLHSSPVGNSLSMRPAISRRGRPPGSKSRKLNCTNEVPEKKMKLEAPPGNVSPSNTGVDIVGRPTSTVPPLSNGVMKSNNLGFKAAPSNPFVSTSPNGFCSSATMSLPPSFITSNSVCSAIFPGPLIPTSFATATMGDISLSQGLTGPFLTLPAPSACAVSCASGMLPPTSSSVLPTDLTTFSKAYSPVKSSESLHSMDYLVQTMDSGASEKSFECEASVCCRCGGPATKEEAFLICKDCCLCAHPTCLDYWPELTDRARQAPWQCADCKTCAVCQNKQPTGRQRVHQKFWLVPRIFLFKLLMLL
ncbi:unnamed protein product [Calicophoron daubneyi]|uniref:Histone acetyltransferase n=1 Tax=Calicophoron daubneyi TaxID=300641 RepID=A0AAV2TJE7_CALDB